MVIASVEELERAWVELELSELLDFAAVELELGVLELLVVSISVLLELDFCIMLDWLELELSLWLDWLEVLEAEEISVLLELCRTLELELGELELELELL